MYEPEEQPCSSLLPWVNCTHRGQLGRKIGRIGTEPVRFLFANGEKEVTAMKDALQGYHPWVGFLYFALVLTFSMVISHPAAQAIALVCALCYAWQLGGKGAGRYALSLCLPLLVFTALVNLFFGGKGATALFYLFGRAVTLEGLLYGVSAGLMLSSVLLWFYSFRYVITSDKLMYLFSGTVPALSLLLSMTLRLVPQLKHQLDTVVQAQRALGRDIRKGSLLQKLKAALTVLSVLVTWALEDGIATADSMKSRGYGLPGRSSFTVYRMRRRDWLVLGWLALTGAGILAGLALGVFRFDFFPALIWAPLTPGGVLCCLAYAALCAAPMILNAKEAHRWKAIG